MASVAHLYSLADTANSLSYVSGSFTPTEGDLLVVGVVAANETDATATLTESAGGGTYTLLLSQQWSGTASRLFVFIADQLVGASPPARTFTATFPLDVSGGCVFLVERVTGMTLAGTAAVVQSVGKKDGNASLPTITFAAACDTANPVLCFFTVFQNPPTVTVLSPFVELVEASHASPATGTQAVAVDSGFTGDTITWDGLSSGGWGMIAVELDASGCGGGGSDVVGTASLTSYGSLSASGQRTVVGAADLLSAGVLAASGQRTVLGAAQLASYGLLVASGGVPTNTVFGTASLTSAGALTAEGQREVVGSAQLASGGVLTAAGIRQVLGVSALTSAAILSAQGQREVLGSAALSSAGVLVAIGSSVTPGGAGQVVGVFDLETGTLIASFAVPTRSVEFEPAERSLDVASNVRHAEYDSPTGSSDF